MFWLRIVVAMAALLAITSCTGDATSPSGGSLPDAKALQVVVDDGWSRFHKYGFAMSTPPGFAYQSMLSPDSFMGAFEGQEVFVLFDFGWYSDLTKHHRGKPEVEETAVTLDGQPGYIWKLQDAGQDPYWKGKPARPPLPRVLILNVPKLNGGKPQPDKDVNGLWVRVRYKDPTKEPEILRMLRSITFPKEEDRK